MKARLVALEEKVARLAPAGVHIPAQVRNGRKPKPQIHPRIMSQREMMWYVLTVRGRMVGEEIKKTPFARAKRISERQFFKWFDHHSTEIQPGSPEDRRCIEAIQEKRAEVEKKLAAMTPAK